MEALELYWKDKYSPAELVEHLDISMEELLFCLSEWTAEHLNDFQEDVELIYGYAEDSEM